MTSLALPRQKHLLPGFRLTAGVTLTYLTLIVALPVAAMLLKSAGMGPAEFWRIVSSPRAVTAYWVTFSSAAAAAAFNSIFGMLLAWVLVRYEFPGKRFIDALVDLPFALPTAVVLGVYDVEPIFGHMLSVPLMVSVVSLEVSSQLRITLTTVGPLASTSKSAPPPHAGAPAGLVRAAVIST